jgi:PBSX family phage terminase large subunit
MTAELRIKLLPKQEEFLNARAREILYAGAFGSGKSRALCYALIQHAALHGNLCLLTRKTLTTLKQTTLRTLLQPDGNLPPVLPEGSYTHNKADCTIKLNGGGEIYYTGFENSDRIRSLNLGCVVCDEATELSEEEYIMMLGRLRNSADANRQFLAACNPSAPSHFLHRRFFEELSPDRIVIHTQSDDNFFLPPDYLAMLGGFSGQNRERYVLGRWVQFEGLVYDFQRARNMREMKDVKWLTTYIALDEGYENPCAIGVWGVYEKRLHCMREIYRRNMLPETVVATVKEMSAEYGTRRVIVDKSAAGLIASLGAEGLDVTASEGGITVFDGIKQVQSLVSSGQLTVDPGCENTIREFESYAWKPGKDEPKKEFDHSLDACRYLVTYLFPNLAAPHIYPLEIKREEKPKEQYAEFPLSKIGIVEVDRSKIFAREGAWR